MIAGIILAAGASERMGTPKALLSYRGETFVGRLVRVLGSACERVTVVLGNHADTIRPQVPNRARVEVNPDPDRGQLSSLQTALAAEMHQNVHGFAFIPVDCCAVLQETVTLLAHAFAARKEGTLFVIPRKGGKRGHPVFAARAIALEMLALAPTAEAREIVHRYVDRTEYVEVEDDGIFTDIDTPEDYSKLR